MRELLALLYGINGVRLITEFVSVCQLDISVPSWLTSFECTGKICLCVLALNFVRPLM